jgi:hypothetical protein
MSNINYSDYYNLIENNYKEKKFANSIYRCNIAALNDNKKYFAISTNDLKNLNGNNCLVGDKTLDLKRKDDILIDPNAFDDDIKSDKMFKLYYIFKTPDFNKKFCVKRKNLNNCLIRSQISYFNNDINDIENKIININAQKKFVNTNINKDSYVNDYNIIRENKRELYYTEKKNAEMWTEFMKNTEDKLNIRKNQFNQNNFSFILTKYTFKELNDNFIFKNENLIIKNENLDLNINDKILIFNQSDENKNGIFTLNNIDEEKSEFIFIKDNEIKKKDCIKQAKIIKKEIFFTNREKIIQQQQEFNYKTSLIKKLNILIAILIFLFFIIIIFYSDTVSKFKKNIENNIKNFSNDFLL